MGGACHTRAAEEKENAMTTSSVPTRNIPLTESQPDPAPDHATALEKFAALQALDGDDVNPVCRSQLLTHGAKVERAIVLMHGMTNCPAQYTKLAPLFFERGYNVLIPRTPRNGLIDLNTNDLKNLTAEEMATHGDQVVDIGRGLGEQVTAVGLSGSAVIAAWLAQYRADLDKAIVVAPVFGILPSWPIFGTRANHALSGLLDALPNIMTQSVMPFKEGPSHGYLGFATHGLSHTMDLGAVVFKAALTTPPTARRVLMVMNDVDPAVNNAMIRDLTARWQKTAPDRVDLYAFPASMGLIHDIIDPQQKKQQTDLVYPILLDLFTK
jgi:alpha-beta hydrolase superfamily lysophospholipase